jgi:hypothetical protein
MEDQDHCTIAEDEWISLLHLGEMRGLDRVMKNFSLDYGSLLDYVYRDIVPQDANNVTRNDECENEAEDG